MTPTEALAKLAVNRAKMSAIEDQLAKSLLIEKVWPEAFEHGKVRIGGHATVHAPHKGTIKITRGDGTIREFPAMEVPFDLWPAGMQIDFDPMPLGQRKLIRRRMK